MNLAIRGIDSSQVKWNNEGSFLNDGHKDLSADFVIANPPFNDSDWSGDLLRQDGPGSMVLLLQGTQTMPGSSTLFITLIQRALPVLYG